MFLHLVINPQVLKKSRMRTYIHKEMSLQKIHTTSSSQRMICQLQLAVHLTPDTVKRVLQISKRSRKLGLWLLKHQMNPIPTRIKKNPPPAVETLETPMLKRLKIPKKRLKRSLVRLQYWYNKFRVTYKDKLKNIW